MVNKSLTVCFTGHRVINNTEQPQLIRVLKDTISKLIGMGADIFMVGGALGFDYIASTFVLTAKSQYPFIRLVITLPCLNHDEKWKTADKLAYSYLLNNADEVIYVSEKPYFTGCMKKRNLYLVEQSDICVAYMKRARSGTSQTVRFARERGLTVINLAEQITL
jgi:uncharacterized phage-like protein YoqJ